MLILHNVRMELSKVREKKKKPTKCDKSTVKCDIGTTKCENGTVKCEKKIREPPNVTRLSHVMLELHNVRTEPASVRKK